MSTLFIDEMVVFSHHKSEEPVNHKVFIISEKGSTMHIHTDPHVYGPEEDTYLLLEALSKENLSGDGLEIGTGTGIIALTICDRFSTFTGTDINVQAVELAQKNAETNKKRVTFIVSDLFSKVEGTFDVIVFNPPYVPVDEAPQYVEDLSYHGGEDGRRVIDQFLSQVFFHLRPKGRVYLVQSSLSDIEKTERILNLKKCAFHIITRKPLFFEELVVFRIEGGTQ